MLLLTGERWFTYTGNMTQHQVFKVIVSEIEMLNKEIDLKIIRGLSYAEESKRHKTLLARLKHATPDPAWWLRRSMRMLTSFVL